ncbi:lipase family protein [Chitinophaga sp. CF418]|uniref:lipase family protein n=1 Tax=Chitinophaga sp. CF418 TaxID=1855287 RepID=UPI00091933A4|nr:lipase family protein [Chitinophaga sp. CF418]SHN13027.1 Lipase (class 3) [Chitinophaga sp. CF418]
MRTISPTLNSSAPQPAGATTAVLLCFVSYTPDPVNDITTYMPGWKIVWNGVQTEDGNYAFIAVDPTGDNYALAIRGSLPPQDIFDNWDAFANWVLEDLDVITRVKWQYATTADAKVSNGAYTAFTNLENMTDSFGSTLSVTDYLTSNVIGNGKQVTITGHSLGGNIANVYSSYFVSTLTSGNHPSSGVSLYTFAAPAPGNADFANDLDAKLPAAWHYQNANDIVPNFPVADTIFLTGLLYLPSPAASAISITYNDYTVTLREGFFLLYGVFLLYGYQQQQNNYTVFGTNLYDEYLDNTAEDWFGQAGAQHALANYAGFLGVMLPVLPSQPMVQHV